MVDLREKKALSEHSIVDGIFTAMIIVKQDVSNILHGPSLILELLILHVRVAHSAKLGPPQDDRY